MKFFTRGRVREIKPSANPLCACGCGGLVNKPKNIFIFNHHHHLGNEFVLEERRREQLRVQTARWLVYRSDSILLHTYSEIIDKICDSNLRVSLR